LNGAPKAQKVLHHANDEPDWLFHGFRFLQKHETQPEWLGDSQLRSYFQHSKLSPLFGAALPTFYFPWNAAVAAYCCDSQY
jgi:hypothetical protein